MARRRIMPVVEDAPVDLAELRRLVEEGTGLDRAFVDGVLRMNRAALAPTDQLYLHERLRERSREVHSDLRARITNGLRGDELRAIFEASPERDHFVEEVLGIAYPPLEERVPGPEQIPYLPSAYDEIVHAFAMTGLSDGRPLAFLDLGSGLGKAVMLAELLTGAVAVGVELDDVLHAESVAAAQALGLEASFACGDARTVPLPRADVTFMYLPFTGTVLDVVLARVAALGPRWLCAGTLHLDRFPFLRPRGEPRSWLQVYAVGE